MLAEIAPTGEGANVSLPEGGMALPAPKERATKGAEGSGGAAVAPPKTRCHPDCLESLTESTTPPPELLRGKSPEEQELIKKKLGEY